jgi:anaerobic selenocysteine-containing dehydrogenase
VIVDLARRVGARHWGFEMTPREIIDWTLRHSGWGTLAELEAKRWIDVQPDFATSHYLNGFAYPDGKFRFKPDWPTVPAGRKHEWGISHLVPALPDHWDVNEKADAEHPFRLVTAPARNYLNSSFNEMPSSRQREGKPRAKIHPEDLAALGVVAGQRIRMGNERGEILLTAEAFPGLQRGVVVVEAIPPNDDFEGGEGLNTLTSAKRIAPFGGAAFHDNHVWIRPA